MTTADILSILASVWVDKHETATRVRQRLGIIFDWVIAQGWRPDNPASQSITKALPEVRRRRKRRDALPHAQVPAAVKKARDSGADLSTKLCFEFLVLTAARVCPRPRSGPGEARLARWEEIDWQELSWTIPPSRMKADREHRVPLSRRVVEVLQAAKEISGGNGLVFPSPRGNKPLSDMTLLRLLEGREIAWAVDGWRSRFVSRLAETEDEMRETGKTALANDPDDDKTEMAYIRTVLYEKRKPVMERWAEYLSTDVNGAWTGGARPSPRPWSWYPSLEQQGNIRGFMDCAVRGEGGSTATGSGAMLPRQECCRLGQAMPRKRRLTSDSAGRPGQGSPGWDFSTESRG